MSKKTLYPNNLSQSTGNNITSFSNLSNLKNNKASYAVSGTIAKKSQTKKRPAAITAKNFKANIPAGSKINKVTVEYAADIHSGKVSIGKPTIDILNITGSNQKGKALTTTMTKSSASWSGDRTIADINSSNFGVKITFPDNTKDETGTIKLKYIRIIIDYTVPNYNVAVKKVQGKYKNEEHLIQLTLSNVNKTKQGSNVNIQLPSNLGFIYKEGGDGVIIQNSTTSLTWNTYISTKSSVSVVLRVLPTTSATHNIKWSETGSGHTGSFNLVVTDPPSNYVPPEEEEDEPIITDEEAAPVNANVLYVEPNEEFSLDFSFEDESVTSLDLYACLISTSSYGNDFSYYSLDSISEKIKVYIRSQHQWIWQYVSLYVGQYVSPLVYDLSSSLLQNKFKCEQTGEYAIVMCKHSTTDVVRVVNICVVPTLTTANFTRLQITGEDLNRLGDSITYTVQSWLKITSTEHYVRDWYKNFRIGVFNNPITSNFTQIATLGTVSSDEVTATLTLPEEVDDFEVTSDYSIEITKSSDSIVFAKSEGNPQVLVKIEYLDDEENIVATEEYYIDFDENTVETLSYNYDPTDYSDLSDETLFANAEYWGETVTSLNAYQSLTCDFPYNEKYPLIILLTGDYPQGNPDDNNIKFTEPCIIESDVYNGAEVNGNYPIPILSLIDEFAEEPSEIKLSSFEESTHIILYHPELTENYGTSEELAVRGIQVTADIDFTDDLILYVKLKVRQENNYLIGNRSIVISSEDDHLTIGGTYDTWGLQINELINLDQLELELGVNNILEEEDADMLLKNIQLTVYSNPVDYQSLNTFVEGENVSWYGMNVTNVEIPFGRNTETKYLNIEGTDTNLPYRQNIKEKIIKLHFDLDGCDLNETTQQLQQLAKLFTNERDELNVPIPKSITFSHIPDKVFYYILEETFDTDIQISDYKGTIELTIPDGTAFDIEDTVTNVTGYVEGIAAVNPIITITHITNSQIVLYEVVSSPNQEFKLNNDNLTSDVTFETNDTIIINCLNRTCSITKAGETENIDISEAVDFNSDWFKIQGEFEFIADNCVIQTVTYNTRS